MYLIDSYKPIVHPSRELGRRCRHRRRRQATGAFELNRVSRLVSLPLALKPLAGLNRWLRPAEGFKSGTTWIRCEDDDVYSDQSEFVKDELGSSK